MARKKIPRSDLLDELQRLADDLGRSPMTAEMDDCGKYSASTYQNRFGSWNDALRECGLAPREKEDVELTDEELLDELRRLADDLDRSPTMQDVREHGAYSPVTYHNRFGSFNDAKSEIGLGTTPSGRMGTQARLLTESVDTESVTYADLPEPARIDADRLVVEIGREPVALSIGTRLDIGDVGCRIDGLSPAVGERGCFGWVVALQLRSGRTVRVWLSDLVDRIEAGGAEVVSP